MHKWMLGLTATVAGLLVSGCIETSTTLRVAKDGSARLLVSEYMGPQLSAAMSGAGKMMLGGETNAAPKTDIPAMFKTTAEQKARSMGEGVSIESFTMATNATGWVGYKATYFVKDLNQLKFGTSGGAMGGNKSAGGSGDGKDGESFKVEFKRGPVCELALTPLRSKTEKPAPAGNAPAGKSAEDAEMAAAMMPMMAAMFQGMRISLNIEVEGKIVETNGKFKEGDRTIVIMDVPMGQLMANPEVQKIMASAGNGPGKDPSRQLAALNIEGLRIEDPDKTLRVKFQ